MALQDIIAQRQSLLAQIAELDRQIELAESIDFLEGFSPVLNDIVNSLHPITRAAQMPTSKEESDSLRTRLRVALRDQQITVERALHFIDNWSVGTKESEDTKEPSQQVEPLVVEVLHSDVPFSESTTLISDTADKRILDLIEESASIQQRIASKFRENIDAITIHDASQELRVGRIPFNGPERQWLTTYIKKHWGQEFILKGA